MTVKKKIFYYNTGVVLVSLMFLLGAGGVMIALFKEEFLNRYSQNAKLAPNTYEVQKMMQETSYGTNWDTWSRELSKYNFRFHAATKENEKLYSNLKHSEWEGVEELLYNDTGTEKIQTFFLENVTVVSEKLMLDGETYYLYAAYCQGEDSVAGMDRGIFEMFLILFLVIGVIIITAILCCSQFLTRKILNRILEPVNQLDMAAQRIAGGDLENPILYRREDEFKRVCNSFDFMQKHLKEEMEKNKAYEKARTEMVSGISHDLRTPLTSVKGYIKGMLDGIANTEEKRKQYLEIAYRKSCDMDVLLSKLFYFSKLETGNMPFFKQNTNMSEFLFQYAEAKKGEFIAKKADIFFAQQITGECVCYIDKEQMKRVFDNLVENSLKYSGCEKTDICIQLKEDEKTVQIIFRDNGKGMDNEKIEHIFEQFYRADESRNSECDGNGLGLYVCRYIIKEHKGTIRAANKNGFQIIMELPKI